MHSIWMVGDIQGCCSSLDELLAHPEIAQEPLARFWFAGDLVNRGSQSLATLRRLMPLEERSVAILGNHDLHLLAVAAGGRAGLPAEWRSGALGPVAGSSPCRPPAHAA
jgi:bis(5'-nucleosyl)-tetraphosphatase (symmetrical)